MTITIPLIALMLHSGLLCRGQLYYERNPLPVETLPSFNYEEDYTEGYYDFQEQVYRWNVGEYPHPQRNPKFCGRVKESFVCDPDGVLDREQADKLDAQIRQLYQETPCICGKANCKEGEGGIVVGIALLKTLFQPYNQHPSKTIRSFAETLRNMWKLGKCDNDILIVVATIDRLSFTDVGKATSSYVSLDEAHRIFLEHKAHFSAGNFYEGLRAMVGDYHLRTRTMQAPAEGVISDTDMGVMAGGIVGAVALLGIVLFVGFVVYRHCKNKGKDVEMADNKPHTKSEGVNSSSWTKRDIKVLFNSLKSTDKRSQTAKYQPCETDEAQPTKQDSFVIGDEVINMTLATPGVSHNETQVTAVTDADTSDAATAMLDRELTEAVEGIAQTFKPKRDMRGRHETDL